MDAFSLWAHPSSVHSDLHLLKTHEIHRVDIIGISPSRVVQIRQDVVSFFKVMNIMRLRGDIIIIIIISSTAEAMTALACRKMLTAVGACSASPGPSICNLALQYSKRS